MRAEGFKNVLAIREQELLISQVILQLNHLLCPPLSKVFPARYLPQLRGLQQYIGGVCTVDT